ncbi:tyrosine-type recombinase/integrase [Rhizobium sp. Leaf453]|uniref:tyrosine-type recombinase/integrase n=1 Tax=Rhizobium sp. Leaf453 TaxID=1736380 RepID=UPI000714367A|nr:tyrosine-type recombinase/integrase [Rhizobium sp. Leaf453]KQT96972.1 integrase [Rhizobium sp. Leaf453]
MTDEPRPYLSSFEDRHGRTRWRYRRSGKTISIAGQPGEPDFEEAYLAAVEGRPARKAIVIAHPGATVPKSFKDAWKRVLRTPEWIRHDLATKAKNTKLAEDFLLMRVVEEVTDVWGDMLVSDFRRRHAKDLIARLSATPHKAKHMLVAIRKMILVALDEEWIDTDPTYKLSYRPASKGWRAWTEAEREAYEATYPIGTAPRTCYALALWLGNRRSDVATLRWDMFDWKRNVVRVEQEKGGKVLLLPITPMLRDALAPVERKGDTVLLTAYGKPFSAKSLTGTMAKWTFKAGLPAGCTMHGLRKSLGKLLAEGGASTRQLMETLGHDDIEHAELYSREASQAILAKDGMSKVTRLVQGKKKRG